MIHSLPDAKVHLKWACCELLPDKASQWVLVVKNSTRRHKRCRFNPCVGKIPWRPAGQTWSPGPQREACGRGPRRVAARSLGWPGGAGGPGRASLSSPGSVLILRGVGGPGGAGSRLLVRGRWAREGQPVLSGECLDTGRGGGTWGPDPAAHWEWIDRVSFPTRPSDLYRVGL